VPVLAMLVVRLRIRNEDPLFPVKKQWFGKYQKNISKYEKSRKIIVGRILYVFYRKSFFLDQRIEFVVDVRRSQPGVFVRKILLIP
jgi:hypothetical protein